MFEQSGFEINRREMLKVVGAGMAAAAVPTTMVQPVGQQSSIPDRADLPVITRKIPRSGEQIPAVGLGTFMTFDLLPGDQRDNLTEVLKRFWMAGGRVIDTSPLYGMAEVNVGQFTNAVGVADETFVSNKIWSTGEYLADDSHAMRSLELSRQRLWRQTIDLMQCHSLVNAEAIVPLLKSWKKEGRIRYFGVTHYEPAYFDALAEWVEEGDVDFVQVHYSLHTRLAEQRILPAAADRGIAVTVNMPFEKARLFRLVETQRLPEFAKELEIETWSAFFLKWITSHPAVTCVLPATTNPDHLTENMSALRGPLPDEKMRQRMLNHMETIPGFDRLAEMPWYPGKTFHGVIKQAQLKLESRGRFSR